MAESTVAIFPGQGSQHVEMGKDLCNNFPYAKKIFEEASDAISLDLKKLCFDDPDKLLNFTENTQPALLTTSIVAFRVAKEEKGITPSLVAGHSLGEYSALVAAEAVGLATAVKWVRARGKAMQEAVPAGKGGMAAILGLDDEIVEKLCADARDGGAEVFTANFNAPGQVVIAGSTEGVQAAMALTNALPGGKALLLPVSAPFHCKLMDPAKQRMAEIFTGAEPPSTLTSPYVPNRTAKISDDSTKIFELLIDQVDHPVLWSQSVTEIINAGHESAIEFGPGKVLAGLAKRISKKADKPFSVVSVGDTAGIKNL